MVNNSVTFNSVDNNRVVFNFVVRMSHHARRRAGPPRLDAANLAGITTLMNPQNVKPGLNLGEAEKAVMGKSRAVKDTDPVDLYTRELNRLAEDLGIELFETAEPASPAPAAAAFVVPAARKKRISDLIDNFELTPSRKHKGGRAPGSGAHSSSDGGSSENSGSGGGSDDSGSEGGSDDSGSDDSGSENSGSGGDDDNSSGGGSGGSSNSGSRTRIDKAGRRMGLTSRHAGRHAGQHAGRHAGQPVGRTHTELPARRERVAQLTDEQERRQHINSVVADIRGETRTTFGVERERTLDAKASKLEQIGQLRMTLEEEGVDCSSVSSPSSESPMAEIDSVLNILRLKNDRNRYSSLAEEVVLGVAEGIETVFDGTRSVPVLGWRPDYTGYSSTVNSKLHRMRFETSQVVGNIIERYNIGPTARIIMELLPSLFLYPRLQKKQRGEPGLAGPPHVGNAHQAFAAIRDSDRPKNLDDVLSI